MSRVYGYRMAHEPADQLYLWFVFKAAIQGRYPVRVSYFKRKKNPDRKPAVDRFGNPVFVKITRVVEPYELGTTADGAHIVRVVDRTPEGVGSRPEYRMIRLDSIAVRYADQKPVVTSMRTHGYLCPSPLDGEELHPTKGGLALKRKPGILLTTA